MSCVTFTLRKAKLPQIGNAKDCDGWSVVIDGHVVELHYVYMLFLGGVYVVHMYVYICSTKPSSSI